MVILAFATVYIVWGSTYFFIQKAVHGFPPFILGAIRFIIAGGLMLGWAAMQGEKLFDKTTLKQAAISGVLMLFIGNGAVIWVEQYMPSAMVAILISSSPIWFVVLDKPKWRENFTSRSILTGLVIGFAGVVLLFGEKINAALADTSTQLELGGDGVNRNWYHRLGGRIALFKISSFRWVCNSEYRLANVVRRHGIYAWRFFT